MREKSTDFLNPYLTAESENNEKILAINAAHEHPENFSDINPECTYLEGEERHIVSEMKKEQ